MEGGRGGGLGSEQFEQDLTCFIDMSQPGVLNLQYFLNII